MNEHLFDSREFRLASGVNAARVGEWLVVDALLDVVGKLTCMWGSGSVLPSGEVSLVAVSGSMAKWILVDRLSGVHFSFIYDSEVNRLGEGACLSFVNCVSGEPGSAGEMERLVNSLFCVLDKLEEDSFEAIQDAAFEMGALF